MSSLWVWLVVVGGCRSALPTFTKAGTHLVAEDIAVSTITLSPKKFLSYLRDDGLDHVEAARREAKKDTESGRERYLRCLDSDHEGARLRLAKLLGNLTFELSS